MKYHQRSFSVQNAGVVTCALSVVVGKHAKTTEQNASVNEVNGFIKNHRTIPILFKEEFGRRIIL